MTRRGTPHEDHRPLADQAVLYALSALDPADEQTFRSHLAGCGACQRDVAALLEVTARLAEALPEDAPSPGLRDRIVTLAQDHADADEGAGRGARHGNQRSVAGGSHPPALRPPVRTAQRRLGRPAHASVPTRRRLALVAAAVAVVAGGLTAGLALSRGGIGSPPTTCTIRTGCRQVELASTHGHRALATVVLEGRSVWLRTSGLPPNDAKTHLYVLWEIAGHRPRAIAGFDVVPHTKAPLAIGSLPTPPGPVRAFAVSLEPGRTIPKRPSDVVAVGPLA